MKRYRNVSLNFSKFDRGIIHKVENFTLHQIRSYSFAIANFCVLKT